MQSWIVILYIIVTKTKYRNGLNAAPDIMLIHLFQAGLASFCRKLVKTVLAKILLTMAKIIYNA